MEPDGNGGRDPAQTADAHGKPTANPGYALGQLARALNTSETHPDSVVRERAERRAETWLRVFKGMLAGILAIGSRSPVGGTPSWATLKVAMGGFATGELLAGGSLQPHETALVRDLGLTADDGARGSLNAYYLSEAGLDALRGMLQSGCYRIDVPEEGALLTVAWLAEHGSTDRARAVLDEITPWFGRLRFFPIPQDEPQRATSLVHVQGVGQTVKELGATRESPAGLAQRETLLVWNPLFDEMVELFLETVEGSAPSVATDPGGAPQRDAHGRWQLSGGWPCQRYPDRWSDRALSWLGRFKALRAENRRCRRPELPRKNFAQLRGYLEACIKSPKSLRGRDVGRIRMILAQVLAKRGEPKSARCRAIRETQEGPARQPLTHELAAVLAARIGSRAADTGIETIEPVLAPITSEESARFGVPFGAAIPERLQRPLIRCLDAAPEVLVRRGAITSADTLARVLPQLTAGISARGIDDPDLARLSVAIYEAFRRRRSLLLLNLQRQVGLSELPWVAAVEEVRADRPETRQAAQQLLQQIVRLAFCSFPHRILPNKLVQELRALVERAQLDLPLVDEVAADIFMGEFTEKYLRAAQRAARHLSGSLYERYYGISYEKVLRIDDVTRLRGAAPTSRRFLEICTERSGRAAPGAGQTARNGAIIEQEQILTTHNVAVLIGDLGLRESLQSELPELSRRCFKWVCGRQQTQYRDWRARLHMVKDTAYAWRQMMVFLSFLPASDVSAFSSWAERHFEEQRPWFRSRFRPALAGLKVVVGGGSLDDRSADSGARRVLGWAAGEDWLLGR